MTGMKFNLLGFHLQRNKSNSQAMKIKSYCTWCRRKSM